MALATPRIDPEPPGSPAAPDRRGAIARLRVRSHATVGLFILACLYTVAFARPFLLPLTVAFMLHFLLIPVVRLLKRLRIPEPVGATLVVAALVGSLSLAVYALSWPASEWMAKAPESLRRIEQRAQTILKPIRRVTQTAEQMERIATVENKGAPEVKVSEPGLGAMVFGGMQAFLAGALVVFTLLFFLLASGDRLMAQLVKALPRLQDRKRAADIAREIERQVSAYLYVTTLVNLGFGAVVAATMLLLRMPNALLWGVLAAITSFIPYLGGVLCTVLLGMAAVLAFPDWQRAVLVPLVFAVLDTLKGYVVAPLLTGRRLTLNTPVLFIGLLFWWWVWGIPGALLAVPILSVVKIVCERIDGWRPLAEFLGDGPVEADAAAAAAPAAQRDA
jgi:predicted PurR-regulated permease PerM